MLPASLKQVIAMHQKAGRRVPRVLYTVPTGQNPTGAVTPLERKQEIYQICRDHDIVVIEDDPYYYLQYSVDSDEPRGLSNLGKSYLSVDVDGRVIRLDSFSKFLAPGMRLGWCTAHPDFLQKLLFALHASTMGPCSLSQVVINEILQAWGREGLETHLKRMQSEYQQRAAVIQQAAEKHLTGLAEWQAPRAGMFLWLKLLGVKDSWVVFEKMKEVKVVVVPGDIAHCHGPNAMVQCPYIRMSYSQCSPEELSEGIRRLAQVLQGETVTLRTPVPRPVKVQE